MAKNKHIVQRQNICVHNEIIEHINNEFIKIILKENGETKFITDYVLKEKSDREKQQLELQIQTLRIQIDENMKLRKQLESDMVNLSDDSKKSINNLIAENEKLELRIHELENENKLLKSENKELKMENQQIQNDIRQLKMDNKELRDDNKNIRNSLELNNVYKKFSDTTHNIYYDLHDALCSETSTIMHQSGDNNIHALSFHLQEIETKNIRTRKIRYNTKIWNEIYDNVVNILKNEFGICNIKIFYEIIKLHAERNDICHTTEKITFDELKKITPYANELFDIISNYK